VRVNPWISDLFFNHDLSGVSKRDSKGMFDGYDEAKLNEEADFVLLALDNLGVATPTRDELIADFYDRL
jgi:hypothetical protein